MNALITKKQKQIITRKMCKYFGVKYRIRPLSKQICGYAIVSKGIVIINSEIKDKNEFISTLMHEIKHIIDYREGRWPTFFKVMNGKPNTIQDWNKYKKIALRVESWTDKKSAQMTKKFFPKIKFFWTYKTKTQKEMARKYINNITNYYIQNINKNK